MSAETYHYRQQIEEELARTAILLAEEEAHLQEVTVSVDAYRSKIALLKSLLSNEILQVGSEGYRAPLDMLRPRFKGSKMASVIVEVLENSAGPMTPKEMVHLIYQAGTPEELERAKNSLSAELRAGARGANPKWYKVGRAAYLPLCKRACS